MKNFRSEHAFEKYKPHITMRQKLAKIFRKKQYIAQPVPQSFHHKSNPFTRPEKKVNRSTIKIILLLVLTAFWIACLAYLPYFRVNKVNYVGLENNSKTDLDTFIYQNYLNKQSKFPINNYFFINAAKIAKDLNNKFLFESVAVKKVFPNQLNVTVIEKKSAVIYDNSKKYFLLDSEGTVIKYLTDVGANETTQVVATATPDLLLNASTTSTTPTIVTGTLETPSDSTKTVLIYKHTPDSEKINKLFGNYPTVYDKRNLEINIKQTNILPADYIADVLAWQKDLTEQGTIKPKFYVLDDLNSGTIIDTNQSWNILFQPKENNQAQINTFREVLPTIKPKEYIDLRFGGKVYWK